MLSSSAINRIANTQELPVYCFDESAFAENYNYLVSVFRQDYPKYELSYSYKTNYTPYICSLVKELGGYAEVVSDMEYTLARKLGYENPRIIYNGPFKGPLLEEHLAGGGIVNVDNLSEARRICAFAERNPQLQIKLGVRVNIDLGRGLISRFGLEPWSEEMDCFKSMVSEHENLRLVGIHCHLSHSRDLEAWQKRTEIMLRAADTYIDGVPEYISLGSGMFGYMEESLAKQFNCDIPDYSRYSSVTMKLIADHYSNVPDVAKPIVFTEPGATVISAYIHFITKVEDIKTIRGKTIAVCNGSFYNLGEITHKKNLPLIVVANANGKHRENVDLVGYTCLEYDVLYRNYSGKLSVGDILVLGNVGGYSIVSKPQFIQPNCPMLVLKADGQLEQIMRRETFEDVFAKFIF